MMSAIRLSDKANAICEANYKTCWKGNGCDRCPIVKACHSPRVPHTQQALNEMTEAVNRAADGVTL